MSNNNQLTPKQQKGCAIGCLSIVGIIFIILIGAFAIDTFNNSKKSNAAEKSLDTSLPMEERLEYAVIGALGEENNMGDLRNVTIGKEGDGYVITFLADESTGARTLEMDIIDVMEGIQPIQDLNLLVIRAQTGFVDKYGNEAVDNGLNVIVYKEEINKINFENFYSTQLKDVVFAYNLHPGISK